MAGLGGLIAQGRTQKKQALSGLTISAQQEAARNVAQEQLDTVMPKCSPKDSGNVKVVGERIEFGGGWVVATPPPKSSERKRHQ